MRRILNDSIHPVMDGLIKVVQRYLRRTKQRGAVLLSSALHVPDAGLVANSTLMSSKGDTQAATEACYHAAILSMYEDGVDADCTWRSEEAIETARNSSLQALDPRSFKTIQDAYNHVPGALALEPFFLRKLEANIETPFDNLQVLALLRLYAATSIKASELLYEDPITWSLPAVAPDLITGVISALMLRNDVLVRTSCAAAEMSGLVYMELLRTLLPMFDLIAQIGCAIALTQRRLDITVGNMEMLTILEHAFASSSDARSVANYLHVLCGRLYETPPFTVHAPPSPSHGYLPVFRYHGGDLTVLARAFETTLRELFEDGELEAFLDVLPDPNSQAGENQ